MKQFLVLFSLLSFSCFLQAEPAPTLKTIENDLKLKAVLTTPATVKAGEPVEVRLVLHNTSKTESYRVVKPGDGSEAGWREPSIYFTGTLDAGDGKARELTRIPLARCGLFDPDWQKDIVVLKPGEKLPVSEWIPHPSQVLEFRKTGHVRIVAHYVYSAGEKSKGEGAAVNVGTTTGIPAFELVSAPVELDIR